ncbi:MAG: transaldolase [Alcaligenaceae bacterium]|jgi:transaldolase|nr:transaldolase [Alcaligenaceae bacterium]
MTNQLESLAKHTTIVADTGDFEAIRQHQPTDATTNPSLILKAIQDERYRPLLDEVIKANPQADTEGILDHLLVLFGQKILEVVPGRVSTEVDARLSFDTEATVARARRLIEFYKAAGIDKSRILIKIASTWEGIEAAKQLEREGIHTNLTLLFSLSQAVACAQAGVTLISPFVGRIYDWYKKQAGADWDEVANAGLNDPGVKSVTAIFNYYKKFGITTEIMGASFRNIGQIQALSGCDLLTISPDLLQQLSNNTEALEQVLDADKSKEMAIEKLDLNEASFRFLLNEDAMATEKLAEGIRNFVSDAIKLDKLIEAAR